MSNAKYRIIEHRGRYYKFQLEVLEAGYFGKARWRLLTLGNHLDFLKNYAREHAGLPLYLHFGTPNDPATRQA